MTEDMTPNPPAEIKHIHAKDLSFRIPDCVGKNIKHLRKEKHMTQKQLANAIGCEASYISHIERVSRSISIRHLFKIAEAMETNPATLVSDGSNHKLAECFELLEKLDAQDLDHAREWLEGFSRHPYRHTA